MALNFATATCKPLIKYEINAIIYTIRAYRTRVTCYLKVAEPINSVIFKNAVVFRVVLSKPIYRAMRAV